MPHLSTAKPAAKAGWRIKEWAPAVGIGVARTWELIAERRIDTVKLGASRIITTSPTAFLESLKNAG